MCQVLRKLEITRCMIGYKIVNFSAVYVVIYHMYARLFEPHCEKTCLLDFRPGLTQTGLYCQCRRCLEA